jgi:AbrB family looped-hinge helix DNA binding protein
MEFKTKVSVKGQIVIPKELREKYGYREGVEVTLKPLNETTLIIERAPRLTELFGFLGGAEASKILLEEREKEVKAERQRRREIEVRETGE